MRICDIVFVGGGASGLIGAIVAANTDRSLHIAIVERGERVGRKLLSTGNGRCNLSNMHALSGGYHGDADAAREILCKHPPEEIVALFGEMGLRTTVDEAGRVYPLCNQAAAVLDTLRLRAEELGIEEVCDFDCASITPQKGQFCLKSKDNVQILSRRVVVCAGGMAAPKIGGTDAGVKLLCALGHTAAKRLPSLSQLETSAEITKPLKGLRYQGGISLMMDGRVVAREEGEILFGDGSISGIAAMQLSREAGAAIVNHKKTAVCLHMLSDRPESLFIELESRAKQMPQRECNDFLTGYVGKRIGQCLCKQAGIAPLTRTVETLGKPDFAAIARTLTGWELPIYGVKGFENAQVTAGGVYLRELDKGLQSVLCKGLFAAGEVLNVDGDCGGYNLQWAWASGIHAGTAAARSLAKW